MPRSLPAPAVGRGQLSGSAPAVPTFEALLTAHLDALYRTALRLCGSNVADAEDLLQEAALRAFEGFGALREREAGRAWLFTILVRTHLNRARTVRRRAETLESDLDEAGFESALAGWSPVATPVEVFHRRQLRESIARAIEELPAELGQVVALMDVEGFRQREAAAILGLPEGTVASRLFRARRLLRQRLADACSETSECQKA